MSRNENKKKSDTQKSTAQICKFNYFTIFATSSAKLSSLFSRPSPFTRRTKLSTLISAPVVFATLAT